jgi:predicted 3-demethylubiquinone-9 3-methyltransferase (glyoxalase superfamily)
MSWQIVPKEFDEMMNSGDPVRTQRMIDEMMTQQRLDMAKLRAAFDGA